MFIALDQNNNRVTIENANKNSQYFCPVCGEPLIIRAESSDNIKTHFAHKRGTICYDDFKNDMSEWHLNWQNRFPEQYREIVIEKDREKHRADILINDCVIEFQHSPISSEEILKRNKFYLSCGYKMVWVFDATDKIKRDFEESIDPLDDPCLRWKRADRRFSPELFNNVSVFLHYKVNSDPQCIDPQNEVMIQLSKIHFKYIYFYKTYSHIHPENFLKEFGVNTVDCKVKTITEIINEAKEIERQKEIQLRYKPLNNIIFIQQRRRYVHKKWHF